jgi:hypothetical protein
VAIEELVAYIVYTQTMLVPILLGTFFGIREERKKKEALYFAAIRSINPRFSRRYGR